MTAITTGIWVMLASQVYPGKGGVQTNSTTNAQKGTKSIQKQTPTENEAMQGLISQELQIQQQDSQILQAAENQSTQDVAIERKLVTYTEALVLVGLIQAAILGLTVIVIRNQISAVKDTERAWIIINPIEQAPELYVMQPNVENFRNVFAAAVKNAGRTSAQLIESWVLYQIRPNLSLPDEPEYGPPGFPMMRWFWFQMTLSPP